MNFNSLDKFFSVQSLLVQIVILLVLQFERLYLMLEHHVVVRHLQLYLLCQRIYLLFLLFDKLIYLLVLHPVEVLMETCGEAD